MTAAQPRSTGLWIAAGIALAFGALTLVSGGRVLFGAPETRAAAGNAVPFVLWFNFLSGFAYVTTGVGIALRRPWAGGLAVALALAIVMVFALFGLHILRGGAFEARTVGAMTLRAAVWIGLAIHLRRAARPGSPQA